MNCSEALGEKHTNFDRFTYGCDFTKSVMFPLIIQSDIIVN
jgi:hypothetical protein